MRAHFSLPSIVVDETEGRPPISVKFEIPYFTTSGLQVRFVLVGFVFQIETFFSSYFFFKGKYSGSIFKNHWKKWISSITVGSLCHTKWWLSTANAIILAVGRFHLVWKSNFCNISTAVTGLLSFYFLFHFFSFCLLVPVVPSFHFLGLSKFLHFLLFVAVTVSSRVYSFNQRQSSNASLIQIYRICVTNTAQPPSFGSRGCFGYSTDLLNSVAHSLPSNNALFELSEPCSND